MGLYQNFVLQVSVGILVILSGSLQVFGSDQIHHFKHTEYGVKKKNLQYFERLKDAIEELSEGIQIQFPNSLEIKYSYEKEPSSRYFCWTYIPRIREWFVKPHLQVQIKEHDIDFEMGRKMYNIPFHLTRLKTPTECEHIKSILGDKWGEERFGGLYQIKENAYDIRLFFQLGFINLKCEESQLSGIFTFSKSCSLSSHRHYGPLFSKIVLSCEEDAWKKTLD